MHWLIASKSSLKPFCAEALLIYIHRLRDVDDVDLMNYVHVLHQYNNKLTPLMPPLHGQLFVIFTVPSAQLFSVCDPA